MLLSCLKTCSNFLDESVTKTIELGQVLTEYGCSVLTGSTDRKQHNLYRHGAFLFNLLNILLVTKHFMSMANTNYGTFAFN